MREHIIQWLRSKQAVIEEAICTAADSYAKSHRIDGQDNNFLYDLEQCGKESFNLVRGEDLCYDRYTIGLSYSMWYLGRRINTSLSFALDFFIEALEEGKPLEIFDLGAGTGAVQLALALCREAASEKVESLPDLHIVNVDISPFMLDYNRSYLWPAFCRAFPGMRDIRPEFTVNSWTNPEDIELQTPYIVASYLFDHSENREEITKHFLDILKQHEPEKVVLSTSCQLQKVQLLDQVARSAAGNLYRVHSIAHTPVFSGRMRKVAEYRREMNEKYGRVLFPNNQPSWGEQSFCARILERRQSRFTLPFNRPDAVEKPIDSLDLYLPPMKIRREIKLNPEQKKAAKHNDRPTVILGPAGCGKSVVITERVKNLCEHANYDPSLNILLTTFNKELMGYLADWLEDILNSRLAQRKGQSFTFRESDKASITLMHFDILPTRISNHKGDLRFDWDQRKYLAEAVERICRKENISREDYAEILDPNFLLSEYERVIYGQQYDSLEKYQTGRRSGRPFQLRHNSGKRELIWKVIRAYLAYLESSGKESIHTRRHKLLRDLKGGLYRETFTHIFVDEFQDCTQADYQIFYGLLKDNNQLVIAGDYAQAVHLGKTADVPREDEIFQGTEEMGNRDFKRLKGSYRLPFRISECIRPLSEHIKVGSDRDVDLITPYKGAPPGARPIIVYASSNEAMKMKLLWLLWHFQVFELYDQNLPRRKKITLLEKDRQLSNALNDRVKEIAETDTILRLKGMEKDCIVWSTRTPIWDEEDFYFYAYTILTRTSSVLVIALFDNTPGQVYELLSKLEEKRVMWWDKETERYWRIQKVK